MAGLNHHHRHVFTVTAEDDGLTLIPVSPYSAVDAEDDLPQLLWSSIICLLPPDDQDDCDEHGSPIYTLLYATAKPSALKEVSVISPPESLLSRYLYSSLPTQLDPGSSDVIILVSTTSGGGSAISYNNDVVQPLFRLLNIAAEVEETTSATSIRDCITDRSALSRPQTIVLLSGDTGIFDAINAPVPPDISNLTLAIFPLGTGNAFASSIHLSRGFSPLAALLFGTPHSIPTFRARFAPGSKWAMSGNPVPEEGIIGAVVVSWGFHAALVADSESLRGAGIGVERFKLAAEKNLEPVHEYRGRLSILPPNGEWRAIQSHVGAVANIALEKEEEATAGENDGQVNEDARPGAPHFYALATMCSNLEEAFRISPSSKLGERVIRVVHFPPMEASEVMNLMAGAYQGGTHVDDDRVGYEVAKGVRIEMAEEDENWRRVCVDGGTVVLPRDGWVESTVMEEDEEIRLKVLWID